MPYRSSRFRDLDAQELSLYRRQLSEKLKQAISIFEPDIIHSHHLWIMTSLVKQLFPEIPVVASCHGSDIRQFKAHAHLRAMVLSGCKHLDAVFALSPFQAAEISSLYDICPTRIKVAGAGYDQNIFREATRASKKSLSILYAGKLSNAKGVPWLLKAFKNISDKSITLNICGSGTGSEAEQIIASAQEDHRVVLHGNVDHQTLASYMKKADVFVLPSFFEGVPLVLLEAMACGCRLVTTRLPGVEYVFGAGSESVTIVDLPELEEVDKPVDEGVNAFVSRLTDGINLQLEKR